MKDSKNVDVDNVEASTREREKTDSCSVRDSLLGEDTNSTQSIANIDSTRRRERTEPRIDTNKTSDNIPEDVTEQAAIVKLIVEDESETLQGRRRVIYANLEQADDTQGIRLRERKGDRAKEVRDSGVDLEADNRQDDDLRRLSDEAIPEVCFNSDLDALDFKKQTVKCDTVDFEKQVQTPEEGKNHRDSTIIDSVNILEFEKQVKQAEVGKSEDSAIVESSESLSDDKTSVSVIFPKEPYMESSNDADTEIGSSKPEPVRSRFHMLRKRKHPVDDDTSTDEEITVRNENSMRDVNVKSSRTTDTVQKDDKPRITMEMTSSKAGVERMEESDIESDSLSDDSAVSDNELKGDADSLEGVDQDSLDEEEIKNVSQLLVEVHHHRKVQVNAEPEFRVRDRFRGVPEDEPEKSHESDEELLDDDYKKEVLKSLVEESRTLPKPEFRVRDRFKGLPDDELEPLDNQTEKVWHDGSRNKVLKSLVEESPPLAQSSPIVVSGVDTTYKNRSPTEPVFSLAHSTLKEAAKSEVDTSAISGKAECILSVSSVDSSAVLSEVLGPTEREKEVSMNNEKLVHDSFPLVTSVDSCALSTESLDPAMRIQRLTNRLSQVEGALDDLSDSISDLLDEQESDQSLFSGKLEDNLGVEAKSKTSQLPERDVNAVKIKEKEVNLETAGVETFDVENDTSDFVHMADVRSKVPLEHHKKNHHEHKGQIQKHRPSVARPVQSNTRPTQLPVGSKQSSSASATLTTARSPVKSPSTSLLKSPHESLSKSPQSLLKSPSRIPVSTPSPASSPLFAGSPQSHFASSPQKKQAWFPGTGQSASERVRELRRTLMPEEPKNRVIIEKYKVKETYQEYEEIMDVSPSCLVADKTMEETLNERADSVSDHENSLDTVSDNDKRLLSKDSLDSTNEQLSKDSLEKSVENSTRKPLDRSGDSLSGKRRLMSKDSLEDTNEMSKDSLEKPMEISIHGISKPSLADTSESFSKSMEKSMEISVEKCMQQTDSTDSDRPLHEDISNVLANPMKGETSKQSIAKEVPKLPPLNLTKKPASDDFLRKSSNATETPSSYKPDSGLPSPCCTALTPDDDSAIFSRCSSRFSDYDQSPISEADSGIFGLSRPSPDLGTVNESPREEEVDNDEEDDDRVSHDSLEFVKEKHTVNSDSLNPSQNPSVERLEVAGEKSVQNSCLNSLHLIGERDIIKDVPDCDTVPQKLDRTNEGEESEELMHEELDKDSLCDSLEDVEDLDLDNVKNLVDNAFFKQEDTCTLKPKGVKPRETDTGFALNKRRGEFLKPDETLFKLEWEPETDPEHAVPSDKMAVVQQKENEAMKQLFAVTS